MEDPADPDENTTAFVIFLLVLSALGILWAVSCSWLTGRKKRQRVANNADVDGLVLQIANPMSSAKAKAPDRYSVSDQIIILPIDDLGRSLRVPTIVVTPPSPQDLVADVASLRSDSSIGSADDLLVNDNDTGSDGIEYSDDGIVDETSDAALARRGYVRDSMRNTLAELHSRGSVDSEDSIADRNISSAFTKKRPSSKDNNGCRNGVRCGIRGGSSAGKNGLARNDIENFGAPGAAWNLQNRQHSSSVISINGSHVDNNFDEDDDDFELEQCAPRPRLSSMEPGTKKPNIQITNGRPS